MHRLVVIFAAAFLFNSAIASGLDDTSVVDLVMVHGQTGQPALILSVDKPVDTAAVERQLDDKIGTYIGFVRSGALYARYPKANRGEKPLIVLVFEIAPSARVRANTFGARDRLVQMGFDVELKVYDETTKKNVDLGP